MATSNRIFLLNSASFLICMYNYLFSGIIYSANVKSFGPVSVFLCFQYPYHNVSRLYAAVCQSSYCSEILLYERFIISAV